ncbi:SRPBCC family protein [Sulfurimonas marina]|uniref:SRPBCC family protein n=1 Tax=Sulfurimonas marina TaxID=2590551 RepID=A0A7M1AYM6_9BACT|nr:SRPBCC family protein [Sulfurimonas marina]QOP41492.1 SRPBCC family protein [Sulfurimonas marina]
MTILKDSIEIKASPETIFNALIWVFSTSENFKTWHKDHVRCQWLKGNAFEVGSVLYVEEYLHGKLHKLKFKSIRLEPNRKVEFRLLFPASLICPGGAFTIEQKDKSSVFSATLSFRMSWVFSMFFRDRVKAIKKHMKEEGENLKTILEKDRI